MKVLLRDEETRLYYGTENQWVAEATKAVDFGAILKAGQKAMECQAKVTSVVLSYENPKSELALNPAFCVPMASAPKQFMRL
jgi:hypothetical protein